LIYCSKKRFSKSSISSVLVELFYFYSAECHLVLIKKKEHESNEDLTP